MIALGTSRHAGSELLGFCSIDTNSDWEVASINANLLPGKNMEDQKTMFHINGIFYRFLLRSVTQGSPGLTSLSEQMGFNTQLHEKEKCQGKM